MHMSEESVTHLMNLVMQLRKVCNHPELFERRDAISPLQFAIRGPMYSSREVQQTHLIPVHYYNRSPIELYIPKLIYRTCKCIKLSIY
jgi:DNA helicase INO80